MENAHAASVQEVLTEFEVKENLGLSSDQVRQAQKKWGKNGT